MQVHRAVSHDGRQLAVKVQHEGLRETAHADIVTIELLVGALHYLLPDFDYSWLVETTKENLPLVGAPCVPTTCLCSLARWISNGTPCCCLPRDCTRSLWIGHGLIRWVQVSWMN